MFPWEQEKMYVRRTRRIQGREYNYVESKRTRESAMVSVDVLRNKGYKCRIIKQSSKYFGDCYDIFCTR